MFCYVTESCPEGWTRYGAYCYMFSDEQVEHSVAEARCNDLDATLTSINSQGEQEFHECKLLFAVEVIT